METYFVKEKMVGHDGNVRINAYESLAKCIEAQKGLPFSSSSQILYMDKDYRITLINP